MQHYPMARVNTRNRLTGSGLCPIMLDVCVYIYIYIYICMYIYIHTYVCIYVYIVTYIRYAYIHMHVCIYVCIHVCMIFLNGLNWQRRYTRIICFFFLKISRFTIVWSYVHVYKYHGRFTHVWSHLACSPQLQRERLLGSSLKSCVQNRRLPQKTWFRSPTCRVLSLAKFVCI